MKSLHPLVAYLLLAVTLTAAVTDLRTRRIPNWLTLTGILAGFAVNIALFKADGLATSLFGCGVASLVYVPLYLLKGNGAGDVKLMATVGSLVGPQQWLVLFVFTSLVGGVAALCVISLRGSHAFAFSNAGYIVGELLRFRLPHRSRPDLDIRATEALTLPQAIPILIGTCVYLYVF